MTDDLEREYVLDLHARLWALFVSIAGGAFALIASAIPWYGWHTLIAPVLGAAAAMSMARLAYRFRQPDRLIVIGMMVFQTSIAIGFGRLRERRCSRLGC